MADPKNKGVISDSSNPNHQITSTHRPTKIQKIYVITPLITQFDDYNIGVYQQHQNTTNHSYEFGSSSGASLVQERSPQSPHSAHQESQAEDEADTEPFCYYQEQHVQESLQTYSIWHARNQAVFEDQVIPEEIIIQRAQSSTQAFHQATASPQCQTSDPTVLNSNLNSLQQKSNHNEITKWKRPEGNIHKANCDANLQVPGRWGFGMHHQKFRRCCIGLSFVWKKRV